MKINWNGFLKHAVKEYPNEVCGFLFSKKPYHTEEEWFVFPIKNISETPEDEWIPDRKEMLKAKAKAIKLGLVKIGNVHSHPYQFMVGEEYDERKMQEIIHPSELDLKFARKFNDIIRIIVCVSDKAVVYDCFIHDKFGNKININLEEKDEKL